MPVKVVETGLVYRNPKPYLRAVHAWHPSIVVMPDGELISTFDLGEAAEAMNYRTFIARSRDAGKTWTEPARLVRHPTRPDASHTARLSRMRDGSLVAMGIWHLRTDPDEGVLNRANLGYVASEVILVRSSDGGHTWTPAQVVQPPIVGPEFEVCHPIVELQDGRWLWPTQTWRAWNGEEPNGMKVVAFVSSDAGRTWPTYLDVIDQYASGTWTWENSLTQLEDGRLLAIGWSYHEPRGQSLPNVFAVSRDGRTFTPPRTFGLDGETAKLCSLGGNRVLCVYRRVDQPGLWAATLELAGTELSIVDQSPLWQGSASVVAGAGNQSNNLSALKFGYPQVVRLNARELIVVFWCMEDGVQNIRWLKLEPR
jgi:hypothetical protein